MTNPVRSALRAAAEGLVDRIAAWNRKRLPHAEPTYLIGVHQPMQSERTLEHLAVTGSIPPELNGRYLERFPRALNRLGFPNRL